VTHFGPVYDRPEYSRYTSYLMLERDLRHYLAWGVRLSREQLVIMLEVLADLDFSAGDKGDFTVERGGRALEAETKIDRRNADKSIKGLVDQGLMTIVTRGRPRVNAEDEGEPAIYDLKALFKKFEQWLEDAKPAAQTKARGRRKPALKKAA
jgi:hypothetical protein